MKSKTRYVRAMILRWFAPLLVSVLAACGASQKTATGGVVAGEDDSCDEPELTQVAELPALPSRLAFTVDVSEATLHEQLSRAVPSVLVRAQGRSMGAAGRVSYVVRRDGFLLNVTDEALVVQTRLTADIDVCKPLGPICLHYGACRPEWAVEVSVPQPLSLAQAPRPILKLSMTRGCVLQPVGYNATPELERITHSEARKVRAEVQRRIDQEYTRLLALWQERGQHFRFGEGEADCVSVAPDRVSQTPVQKNADTLHLAVAAEGRLSLGCTAAEGDASSALPLPEVEQVASLDPESTLLVSSDLRFDAIEALLTSQLKQEAPQGAVSLKSGLRQGQAVLLVAIRGLAGCDNQWVEVSPQISQGQLMLKPAAKDGATAAHQWLNRHGTMALPSETVQLLSALPGLTEKLQSRLAQEDSEGLLTLHTRLEPVTQVHIGPDRLQLALGLQGTLAAHIGQASPTP